MDATLSKINAKVLAVPSRLDILHPWDFVAIVVNSIGRNAELYMLDSDYGHMAGFWQTNLSVTA